LHSSLQHRCTPSGGHGARQGPTNDKEDLAVATGQDATLDPDLIEAC
jgi:hypothetical protein